MSRKMNEFLARKRQERQVFFEGAYSLASVATANPSWTRFGATNKAIYCSKKSCRFLNRLRFFNLSMSLFVCSKFASNLLTHNRRGIFNWERRRNIKIFQAFIGWKAPSIMRYRRVQYRLAAANGNRTHLSRNDKSVSLYRLKGTVYYAL